MPDPPTVVIWLHVRLEIFQHSSSLPPPPSPPTHHQPSPMRSVMIMATVNGLELLSVSINPSPTRVRVATYCRRLQGSTYGLRWSIVRIFSCCSCSACESSGLVRRSHVVWQQPDPHPSLRARVWRRQTGCVGVPVECALFGLPTQMLPQQDCVHSTSAATKIVAESRKVR